MIHKNENLSNYAMKSQPNMKQINILYPKVQGLDLKLHEATKFGPSILIHFSLASISNVQSTLVPQNELNRCLFRLPRVRGT